MKRWRFTLGLFLFFIGVLSGVRYLDSESSLYQRCVDHVLIKATGPALYPAERDYILATVQTPGATFSYQGQSCPRLLKRHNEIIEAHLTGRGGDLPQGVPSFGAAPRS